MKKILVITALFCMSLSSYIYAQCTPDSIYVANNDPGLFPTPTEGIDTGTVGTFYNQLFTMIVPTDTTISLPPAPPATLTINTVTVTGITGLPTGLTYTCTPASCQWAGGTNGCFVIDGTPTSCGTYTVTVTVVVNVDAPLVGATDAPAQDIIYTLEVLDSASGCNLIVAVTSTDETVLGMNDGTGTATTSSCSSPFAYLWSDGQITSTATGLAPGSYSVVITDADACTATDSITIFAGPVSINTVNEYTFEVYPVIPNPSSGEAEIRFTSPDYRDVSLTVHNLIGALVISRQIYSEQGLNIVPLNTEDLRPGVYVVQLTDGENTSAKRMVVGSN